MYSKLNQYNAGYFKGIISDAEKIIRLLRNEDIQIKLDGLRELEDFPQLPKDSESRQLKIYKETNEVLKKLYIAAARAIMHIIDSNYAGIHDKTQSYNYASPIEPVAAAEAMRLLPNAYIGGPVKSAVNSSNPNVQMIAIDYFETLPGDIRVSGIFPKDFSIAVKRLKLKLAGKIAAGMK